MNWYISKLTFKISSDKDSDITEFDEQIRLIQAENIQAAYYKASELGLKEEKEFAGNRTQWVFIAVEDLIYLGPLKDGVKIFNSSKEIESRISYIHYLKQKEKLIQARIKQSIQQVILN